LFELPPSGTIGLVEIGVKSVVVFEAICTIQEHIITRMYKRIIKRNEQQNTLNNKKKYEPIFALHQWENSKFQDRTQI